MRPRFQAVMSWCLLAGLAAAAAGGRAASAAPGGRTLEIYYIDTEGGQSTLFVAPGGQSVLIDTGNEGARDAERIVAAAAAAAVTRIDYLLVTHYHGDHIGGYAELVKHLPILNYVDHGKTVQPEQNSPSKQAYDAAIEHAPHRSVRPGERLPVAGLEWTIVAAGGSTLSSVMRAPGAGQPNPECEGQASKDITTDLENAQSVGSVIRYGKFRTVDLGDLLWNWELRLACPINRIGTVDVMLTTHHGMSWSGPRALVHALRPRVAIMNNGTRKGAQVETFQTLWSSPGLEDLWQLHWSVNGMLDYNAPGIFIANLEAPAVVSALLLNPPPAPAPGIRPPDIGNPEHAPAHWIRVSAQADGSFTVSNSRNGFSKHYAHRD